MCSLAAVSVALAWRHLTVVEGDGVQTGEQLSLVLVDSLHLDVKHGVGMDNQAVVLLQERRELDFVLLRERKTRTVGERDRKDEPGGTDGHLFNSSDVSDERVVVGKLEDVLQLMEVSQEIVTNSLREHKQELNQPIRADFPVLQRSRRRE